MRSLHTPNKRTLLSWLATALVMFGFVSLWRWQTERRQHALLALPAAERAELYDHGIRTLRGVCRGEHRDALQDLCRQQAELIAQLPECDDACRALVASQSSRATR